LWAFVARRCEYWHFHCQSWPLFAQDTFSAVAEIIASVSAARPYSSVFTVAVHGKNE
jgi:hypothetical protein